MVHLSITALMKVLSLTMENMTQNNLLEENPLGLGLNFWCITSSEGYLPHVEPYCGVNTDLPDIRLDQGADVVLGLIEKCEVKAGSTITFDNLFISFPSVR